MNGQTKFIIENVVNNPEIKSVLNIGYRESSDPHIMNQIISEGKSWSVLEVFPENCREMERKGYDVIEMDVRNIKELDRKFDAIIWLHGPEHILWEDFNNYRSDVESKARKLVIYQAPIGEYAQGELYENPYEKHISTLYSFMFDELGYNTMNHTHEEDKNAVIGEKTFSAWVYKK